MDTKLPGRSEVAQMKLVFHGSSSSGAPSAQKTHWGMEDMEDMETLRQSSGAAMETLRQLSGTAMESTGTLKATSRYGVDRNCHGGQHWGPDPFRPPPKNANLLKRPLKQDCLNVPTP